MATVDDQRALKAPQTAYVDALRHELRDQKRRIRAGHLQRAAEHLAELTEADVTDLPPPDVWASEYREHAMIPSRTAVYRRRSVLISILAVVVVASVTSIVGVWSWAASYAPLRSGGGYGGGGPGFTGRIIDPFPGTNGLIALEQLVPVGHTATFSVPMSIWNTGDEPVRIDGLDAAAAHSDYISEVELRLIPVSGNSLNTTTPFHTFELAPDQTRDILVVFRMQCVQNPLLPGVLNTVRTVPLRYTVFGLWHNFAYVPLGQAVDVGCTRR